MSLETSLKAFQDSVEALGNASAGFFFCPGVTLEEQRSDDRLWICESSVGV